MAKLVDRSELVSPQSGDWIFITDISDLTDGATGTDKKISYSNLLADIDASSITSGVFVDARIAESNVTQHESALTITESQISDLQSYLTTITGEPFTDLSDTPATLVGQSLKGVRVNAGETALEFYTTVTDTDEKVGVDSGATAGYIGAASNDGVIRTDAPLTYVDGGDFITLGLDQTALSITESQISNLQFYLLNIVEDTTPQLGGQLDVNGQAIGDGTNELLTFVEDASAVNNIEIENEATGSGPIIRSTGDDAAVELNIDTKGTANINLLDNVDVTGNIIVSGTVDGRDIDADGTKLDGIEALADVTDEANVTAAMPLVDETSLVYKTGDATANVRIDVDGITTATTRVLTMPDQNIDLTPGTGSFATAAEGDLAATALQNVVEDTTPQLGGNLDVNGNTLTGYTASRAVETDGSGNVIVSAVTSVELNYLDGVTSAIQTQIDGKLANVVEDTTPQLGGTLDAQSNTIENVGDLEVEDVPTILKTLTAGEAVAAGDLCYYKSDGKMWKADASASSTGKGLLGIATAIISADASGVFHLKGIYTTTGLTAAGEYFMSETAAAITTTAPSTASSIVRLIGYALSTTELLVDPDKSWFEN